MAINPNDPRGSNLTDDEILRRRALQLDNEVPADPTLADPPTGGGRLALFAIAFIAILGVVFYGLNQSPSTSTTTTPTAQVTPANPASGTMAPRPPAGTTTGSATSPSAPVVPPTPSDPAMAPPPPATAPAGGSSTAPTSN